LRITHEQQFWLRGLSQGIIPTADLTHTLSSSTKVTNANGASHTSAATSARNLKASSSGESSIKYLRRAANRADSLWGRGMEVQASGISPRLCPSSKSSHSVECKFVFPLIFSHEALRRSAESRIAWVSLDKALLLNFLWATIAVPQEKRVANDGTQGCNFHQESPGQGCPNLVEVQKRTVGS
jgi:hypothetical protein